MKTNDIRKVGRSEFVKYMYYSTVCLVTFDAFVRLVPFTRLCCAGLNPAHAKMQLTCNFEMKYACGTTT
jgi:hypothetical protein